MATIHDVAKRAGVAPITVSRVINHSGYSSQDTRERVEAAIAELEYVPNRLARSLRSKRTNTLALVITDITNPFFTTVARGVEDTASDAGYTVVFCNTDESETEEQKYLQVVLQQQVDGILLVPARSTPESVEMIQKQDTPVVVLDRQMPPGTEVDVVRCENVEGAYRSGETADRTGTSAHCGDQRPDALFPRPRIAWSGYRRAMAEAGLSRRADIIYYGAFTQASGYEMTQQSAGHAAAADRDFRCEQSDRRLARSKPCRMPACACRKISPWLAFDDLPANLLTFRSSRSPFNRRMKWGAEPRSLLLARLNTAQLPGLPGSCAAL